MKNTVNTPSYRTDNPVLLRDLLRDTGYDYNPTGEGKRKE